MPYSVSDVLPVEDLPSGTSVLVSGPPLTRKRELMIRLLGRDSDTEASIMVTTKMGAGKLLQRYREQNERTPARLRVVDCVTKERGIGRVKETETTSYLSSPRDMTGLSIELAGDFQECYERDIPTRFGIHSLSTFLMYHDLQRVYRMVHVLSGQIESMDALGVFVVDSPTSREYNMLSQLIDGAIETRETDTGCELRLRGFGGREVGWQSY